VALLAAPQVDQAREEVQDLGGVVEVEGGTAGLLAHGARVHLRGRVRVRVRVRV